MSLYVHQTETTSWWKDAVIYQIYPRSFYDADGDGVGDLRGIREKAEYLSHLGVDAVWLTPIFASPNQDWGYDISDYYTIDPIFGDLDEFDALLEELHRREIRLIMDIVVNHTSIRHHWFEESLSDPTGPFGEFYIWKPGTPDDPPNNWDSYFGGSAWEYRAEREEYYLHLFATGQADLNWENRAVRREVYRIMEWWLDRGIDGFRMDVINMISKDQRFPNDNRQLKPPATRGTPYFVNGPKLHQYLRETRLEALQRAGITAIGESPGAGIEDVQKIANLDGSELDMAIQMELMELDHGAGGKWDIIPWSPEDLADTVSTWQTALEGVAWPANFLSNHDQPRAVSRFGDDREYRYESATMLATMLLAQTGTPFIYYGEEIGMPNAEYSEIGRYQDVDSRNYYRLRTAEGEDEGEVMKTIRYMSRDNARSPMQWDSGRNAGFTSGTPWIPMARRWKEISVATDENSERSISREYRKLLRLRKQEPPLRQGRFRPLSSNRGALFGFRKELEGKELLVLLNLSNEELNLSESAAEELEMLGVSEGTKERVYGNNERSAAPKRLAPYEAVMYRL